MIYTRELTRVDRELAGEQLQGFVPAEIFDIHAHAYNPAHFAPDTAPFLNGCGILGCAEHRAALARYLPSNKIDGLYFGLPNRTARRAEINSWLTGDGQTNGTSASRALLLVSPDDSPAKIADELRSGRFCGLKVYHCYAARAKTMDATVSEFAPEWMWELLHEVRGVLMLHLVRDSAIADADNQRELRQFCRAYPEVRLVLAHIGRSFNYRNARAGLAAVADLPNAVVDTSAICEAEPFRAALEILGPQRVLFGSDFPISEARGRCVTTGSSFFWLHPDELESKLQSDAAAQMTLIGIESLLCLREACEDGGLSQKEVADIFRGNARHILAPHLSNSP